MPVFPISGSGSSCEKQNSDEGQTPAGAQTLATGDVSRGNTLSKHQERLYFFVCFFNEENFYIFCYVIKQVNTDYVPIPGTICI